MKKIISIIALCMLVVSLFAACSSKCDICGEKAYEPTAEDEKQLEQFDAEIDGTYCEKHYAQEVAKKVASNFGLGF